MTSQMTFDGDATPDAVLADRTCRFILFRQNGAGTTEIDVYQPYTSSSPFRLYSGEEFLFDAGENNVWKPGDTVGYVKAVTAGTYTGSKKHY